MKVAGALVIAGVTLLSGCGLEHHDSSPWPPSISRDQAIKTALDNSSNATDPVVRTHAVLSTFGSVQKCPYEEPGTNKGDPSLPVWVVTLDLAQPIVNPFTSKLASAETVTVDAVSGQRLDLCFGEEAPARG